MASESHVLILGKSVFMDSLAESLLTKSESKVTRINTEIHDIQEIMWRVDPDLVVYELDKQAVKPYFSIASEYSEVLHLAVDLAESQVYMFRCRRELTESMQELCDCIRREADLKSLEQRHQTHEK